MSTMEGDRQGGGDGARVGLVGLGKDDVLLGSSRGSGLLSRPQGLCGFLEGEPATAWGGVQSAGVGVVVVVVRREEEAASAGVADGVRVVTEAPGR